MKLKNMINDEIKKIQKENKVDFNFYVIKIKFL